MCDLFGLPNATLALVQSLRLSTGLGCRGVYAVSRSGLPGDGLYGWLAPRADS